MKILKMILEWNSNLSTVHKQHMKEEDNINKVREEHNKLKKNTPIKELEQEEFFNILVSTNGTE